MTDDYTIVPLSPLRKVIAARMTEAVRTIPQFRATAEICVDALLALRKQLNDDRPGAGVSLNDLLVKACASALSDMPAVNIQWHEGEIHQYRNADIAVVTAVEGGLATPIVWAANTKSVWQIAGELKDLTGRAARNALKLHEIAGGSFSISNLGMYEVDEFDAIVNPPQCAILAVGRAKPRSVINERHDWRVGTMLRATLTVDHRALDGAHAGAFLAALRRHVEQPQALVQD